MALSQAQIVELKKKFKDTPKDRVLFDIRETFTDSETSRLYGAGIYPLEARVAMRFYGERRGRYLDEAQAPKEPEVPELGELFNQMQRQQEADATGFAPDTGAPNTEATSIMGKDTVTQEDKLEENTDQTPIPERFAEYKTLTENGITTIEQLEKLTREDLIKIPGIADATATKIGLALAEYNNLNS